MTEKTFCDICGKDITEEKDTYSVSLYSNKYQGNDPEFDVCKSDSHKVASALRGLVKK